MGAPVSCIDAPLACTLPHWKPVARERILEPADDDSEDDAMPRRMIDSRAVDRLDDARDDDQGNLRPQRIADMVGQRDVIARLTIAVDAARKRGEPLGHVLFDGPPGLGKTTFAMAIPRELGTTIQIASGAALAAP